MPSATLRVLLAELIDYAGLFPPASLSMGEAVRAFASYRTSPDAWALGRFVVPVARLSEFASEAAPLAHEGLWRVSALLAGDTGADLDAVRRWNAEHHERFIVDVVETRVGTAAAIDDVARAVDGALTLYAEIPVADDPSALIEAIARNGVRAKIRTGGVETSAFPTSQHVARFIRQCAAANIAFKATAGLHHPVRAEYPLSYAANAPMGTMFGFLNVFVAAALAGTRTDVSEHELACVLEERDPNAFTLASDTLRWREYSVPAPALENARARFAIAFGSCSFREPLDDLQHLGLL